MNRILEGLAAQRAAEAEQLQSRIRDRRAAYGYQAPEMEDEAEGQDDPAGKQTA